MSTSNKNLRPKESLKLISVSDVMEELEADNYFDKAHREMLALIKVVIPFKQMREVITTHVLNSLSNAPQCLNEEEQEEKRRHVSQIANFGKALNKAISKALYDKLSREAPVVAKKTLKRLAERKSECSNSMNDGGKKRKQDDDSSAISQNTDEQNKRFQKEDSKSCASMNNVSDESVSSVHTSDLSSFDDEIVVSSEDENGEKQVKRIPFKTAEKAYFDEDFSKVSKSTVHAKNTDEASEKPKNRMALRTTKTSKNSTEPLNISSRPKRERKPNSRYSAAEMYL